MPESPEEKKMGQFISSNINISIPSSYANGFQIGLSLTDVVIVLAINGRTFQNLNIPLPVAKSMAEALDTIIADYENKTKTTVQGLKEMEQLLSGKEENK